MASEQPQPNVDVQMVQSALRSLDRSGRVLCVHSSLRSFGRVEGGAATIVNAILAEGCTLLVPTFSWGFAVPPPDGQRPARNGWDYSSYPGPTSGIGRVYSPTTMEVDQEMGAIPAAVLAMPDRVRGNHPLCSFTAIGPRAHELVTAQSLDRVYPPLEAVADAGGSVVLMGVGLTRMTLLHRAEQVAGRRLFLRWANGSDGRPLMAEVGGCSDGFDNFLPSLAPLTRVITVGGSRWQVLPAAATLAAAAAAIRPNPRITHCGRPDCARCNDAVLGGPL